MSGRKVFTAGEVLQAADVNDYLMDQSVMVFAGTAARGSAIPSPTEGMVTYRSDDDVVEVYNGSSFVPVGPGQILQVVSTTKTDTFSASVTSGATTSITGLTATITPRSTSSKIYAVVSTNALNLSAGTSGAHVILTRGGTPVGGGDSAGSRTPVNVFGGQSHLSGTDGTGTNQTFNYLDSPSTTSSITYGVDLLNVSGSTCTLLLNRTIADSDNVFIGRASSTITLMEVAG